MIVELVYKVVRRESEDTYGPLWAPVTSCSHGKIKVVYKLGQWTYAPKGWGPLAAYSNLPAAIWAALRFQPEGMESLVHIADGYCAIFECAYTPFKGKRRETNLESPVVLWTRHRGEQRVMRLHQLPGCTILCGGIQPVRRVTVKEIAAYLQPGTVMRRTLFADRKAVLPAVFVAQSALAGCALVDEFCGLCSGRVQQFFHELGKAGQPFAPIARLAFEMADKLARAYHVKQPRFLED